MELQNISEKSNVNFNNNENSPLLLEILKNHMSNLEKELVEKAAMINFLLKQKIETSNNTSSLSKTVHKVSKVFICKFKINIQKTL